MITVISKLLFFYLSNTSTLIPLSAHGYVFPLVQHFSGFSSQSNSHNKDLFLILRNTVDSTEGSTIDSIYGLLLLSRALQGSIDTTVLRRLFLLCNKKEITARKIYFNQPPKQNFYLLGTL